jgi:hypothetical protein
VQCYFCPEPYSKDHKCAVNGVFLMELEEGEEDPLGVDITNLEISCNQASAMLIP